jgi:hypothetical protein
MFAFQHIHSSHFHVISHHFSVHFDHSSAKHMKKNQKWSQKWAKNGYCEQPYCQTICKNCIYCRYFAYFKTLSTHIQVRPISRWWCLLDNHLLRSLINKSFTQSKLENHWGSHNMSCIMADGPQYQGCSCLFTGLTITLDIYCARTILLECVCNLWGPQT